MDRAETGTAKTGPSEPSNNGTEFNISISVKSPSPRSTMTRRNVIILAAISIVIAATVAWLPLVRHHRQRQFAETQRFVDSMGGALSLDLVDGNYVLTLSGNNATDNTIHALLPTLKQLPTGFTLLGPGENRLFWVDLSGGSTTEDGLDALSTLRISWLAISSAQLTDASVSSLLGMSDLSGVVLSDVQLTECGMEQLPAQRTVWRL